MYCTDLIDHACLRVKRLMDPAHRFTLGDCIVKVRKRLRADDNCFSFLYYSLDCELWCKVDNRYTIKQSSQEEVVEERKLLKVKHTTKIAAKKKRASLSIDAAIYQVFLVIKMV